MMMRRMVVVLMGRRSYQKPTRVLGLHPICLPMRRLELEILSTRGRSRGFVDHYADSARKGRVDSLHLGNSNTP